MIWIDSREYCLKVENTRYRRYFLLIVLSITIGGPIVLIIIIIIIYKFRNKCPCKKSNSSEEYEEDFPTPYATPGLEIQDIKKNDEDNYMAEKPYYLLDNQNKNH